MPMPGRRWRLLAHEEAGPVELENRGVFDELVVDDWLHIEQMDERSYWMRIGRDRVFVTFDADGRATVEFERDVY